MRKRRRREEMGGVKEREERYERYKEKGREGENGRSERKMYEDEKRGDIGE